MRAEAEREYTWLFRAHFASVARTVLVVVHDRARAEELTQEAFLKLFQNWATVSGYERPDAWVRRVAMRMAVREARREGVRSVLERRGGSADQQQQDRPPDVDLARAVQELAPMQRAAVALYYLDDQPVREIARTLQVSESTVKQHLLRARRRLADLLGEEVSQDAR